MLRSGNYADLKSLELLIKALHWQTDNVEVTAFNLLNGYDANPLLNAISTRLVKGK